MKRILVLLSLLLILTSCQKTEVDSIGINKSDKLHLSVSDVMPDKTVSFMAIGDNLIHDAIYIAAMHKYGEYKFDDLFENIKDFVESKDIAYINQETILGGTELGLSNFPCFNTPSEMTHAIANTGFDWVAASSNHSLDRGEQGIINTLEAWEEYPEINVTGIARTPEERNTLQFFERNGLKIGILGYTYGTNGIPIPDGKDYLVNVYNEEMIVEDVTRARKECDLLVVSMHWGTEYSTTPNSEQEYYAQLMADLGVNAIIGEHPHVIQPMDIVTGKNGNEMLVIYSLGNYVSSQHNTINMLGGCASFDLKVDGITKEVTIENVEWRPTVTYIGNSWKHYTSYFLSDYTNELARTHCINQVTNVYPSREYFINKTNEIMGDEFKIIY